MKIRLALQKKSALDKQNGLFVIAHSWQIYNFLGMESGLEIRILNQEQFVMKIAPGSHIFFENQGHFLLKQE